MDDRNGVDSSLSTPNSTTCKQSTLNLDENKNVVDVGRTNSSNSGSSSQQVQYSHSIGGSS